MSNFIAPYESRFNNKVGAKFCSVRGYDDKFLPKRKTKSSAGYDLFSAVDITIPPYKDNKKPILVPTGVKVMLPDDCYLAVNVRSSMAIKHGLSLPNSTGIIDADYFNNPDNEGHIFVPLWNFSDKDVVIKKGDRIAQGIIQRYYATIDDKAEGERQGGFGSTGRRGK